MIDHSNIDSFNTDSNNDNDNEDENEHENENENDNVDDDDTDDNNHDWNAILANRHQVHATQVSFLQTGLFRASESISGGAT